MVTTTWNKKRKTIRARWSWWRLRETRNSPCALTMTTTTWNMCWSWWSYVKQNLFTCVNQGDHTWSKKGLYALMKVIIRETKTVYIRWPRWSLRESKNGLSSSRSGRAFTLQKSSPNTQIYKQQIYKHRYTNTYIQTHIYKHTDIHRYTNIYTYIQNNRYTNTQIYKQIYEHTDIQTKKKKNRRKEMTYLEKKKEKSSKGKLHVCESRSEKRFGNSVATALDPAKNRTKNKKE